MTLYFLILVPHECPSTIGFDVKIVVKLLFKIVVIVTVSFLNFIFPLNLVSLCYHESLYACLGVHMLRTHCLMAMFATKNVLWIPRVRRVQNTIQGL